MFSLKTEAQTQPLSLILWLLHWIEGASPRTAGLKARLPL